MPSAWWLAKEASSWDWRHSVELEALQPGGAVEIVEANASSEQLHALTEAFRAQAFSTRKARWVLEGSEAERAALEREVALFYGRAATGAPPGAAEPAVFEGRRKDALGTGRLLWRALGMVSIALAVGTCAAVLSCALVLLYTSTETAQPGIIFRRDECIPEEAWRTLYFVDSLREFATHCYPALVISLCFSRCHAIRAAAWGLVCWMAMVGLNGVSFALRGCLWPSAHESRAPEVIFMANLLGAFLIASFPHGVRGSALLMATQAIALAPGYITIVWLLTVYRHSDSHMQNVIVTLVQIMLSVPRMCIGKLVKCVYRAVPTMEPTSVYALSAMVMLVATFSVRMMQAGLVGLRHKVLSAVLVGSVECVGTTFAPYGPTLRVLLWERRLGVPSRAFFSPYQRRALADLLALFMAFDLTAIVVANLTWPLVLLSSFGSAASTLERAPGLITDTAAVLGVQVFFATAATWWNMKVDNLPVARVRFGERRAHFFAAVVFVWATISAYCFFHHNVVAITADRLGLDIRATAYIK